MGEHDGELRPGRQAEAGQDGGAKEVGRTRGKQRRCAEDRQQQAEHDRAGNPAGKTGQPPKDSGVQGNLPKRELPPGFRGADPVIRSAAAALVDPGIVGENEAENEDERPRGENHAGRIHRTARPLERRRRPTSGCGPATGSARAAPTAGGSLADTEWRPCYPLHVRDGSASAKNARVRFLFSPSGSLRSGPAASWCPAVFRTAIPPARPPPG